MKKLLLAAVAVLALSSQAEALDSLPQELRGDWCADADSSSDKYTRQDDCEPYRKVLIGSSRLDTMNSNCNMMKISVSGKSYRVESTCAGPSLVHSVVHTMWIVKDGLRMREDSSRLRTTDRTLPEAFFGKWCDITRDHDKYSTLERRSDCGYDPVTTVLPYRVDSEGAEESCNVIKVKALGPKTYRVESKCENEGRSYDSIETFQISKNNLTIKNNSIKNIKADK